MRIAHLLSQTHLTGAEVYVARLIAAHTEKGHRCWIISDTLTVITPAVFIERAIHNRALYNRIRQIVWLRRFCRTHRIDVMHTHSRAGAWLAHFALKNTPTVHVSTVHGMQHKHRFSFRRHVYGRYVIAVCEHIAAQLQSQFGVAATDIRVVRNPA